MFGRTFGQLTVQAVSDYKPYGKYIFYVCLCSCGTVHTVSGKHLRSGHSYRCTACAKKAIAKGNTKHGLSKTKAYQYALNRRREEFRENLDSLWTSEMEKALYTLQPVCIICGSDQFLSVDHVKPLSKGYGLKPGNAIRLCRSCNSSKKDRDLGALPIEMKNKILQAAFSFENYWKHNGIDNTTKP